MSIKFKKLNNTIVKCKKCPRLIKFSKRISIIKRKQNISEIYWGKPVTGFPQYTSVIFCFLFVIEIFLLNFVSLGHFLHLIIVLFNFLKLRLIIIKTIFYY